MFPDQPGSTRMRRSVSTCDLIGATTCKDEVMKADNSGPQCSHCRVALKSMMREVSDPRDRSTRLTK
ncbi:MAG: hypothetical protein JWO59_3193 [Chloroflexi bacterium]|nr:hypothetical protein [Chloroflexota bacterium]